jgi:transposase InsO family protein
MTAAPAPISIDGGRGATLRFTGNAPGEGRIRAQGDDWVPLREAALLLNRSEGDLRRKCAELERSGEAKKMRLPGARNETWHIHVSFDRRLMRERAQDSSNGDRTSIDDAMTPEELLRAATEERRREATLKARAVTMFRAWRTRDDVRVRRDLPVFLSSVRSATGIAVEKSALYTWDKLCPPTTDDPSRDATAFAAALLDQRAGRSGGGKGVSVFHPKAWEAFEAIWLDPRQPSIAYAHRRVVDLAKQHGWAWPGERRVAQLVKEKISPMRACLLREGEHAYTRKFQPSMEQDADKWAPMQCWVGDHARLDFFVGVAVGGKHGGEVRAYRPWLSLWLDWRTRAVVGYTLTLHPNAHSIKAALLDGARRMEYTLPEHVWVDNGKDYQSAALHGLSKRARRDRRDEFARLGGLYDWDKTQAVGIFGRLAITPHFAIPKNHNGKSRIERFFLTLHSDFDVSIESYCGGNPGMVGEEHRRAAHAKENAHRLPTLEEIRPKLDAWIEHYNHSVHRGMTDLVDDSTGEHLSPMQYMARFPHHTRRVAREDAIALLEPRIGNTPYKVGKDGITVTIAKQRIRFGGAAPELHDLKGSDRRVWVSYDPADTSRIRVYDDQMRFVCIAEANERFGAEVTEEAWARVNRIRKAQRAEAKRKPDRAARLLSDAELATHEQRKLDVQRTQADIKRTAPEVKEVPALRIVRTGLEGQREQVEREEMRKAAGAESLARESADAVASFFDEPSKPVRRDAAPDLGALLDSGADGDTPDYLSFGELLR